MAVVYKNFFGGAFFGGGFFGPGVDTGGGDSTRLRRRRISKNRKWRYWWEKEDLKELDEIEDVVVLSKEQVLLDPVMVEKLWAERAALNDYIVDVSASEASKRVMDRLREISQYIQARIDAETARQRRIKKKRMLLLWSG